MIIKTLQNELEERIKKTTPHYLGYLKNIWGGEHLLIVCPDLQWTNPSIEVQGWEALRKFSGTAAVVFPTERMESFDLTELIAELSRPIQVQLNPDTQTGGLGLKLNWQFNSQKDEMGEFNITSSLLGNLHGTLYRKE